jgi:hypothetical protein|tara:strand:+ start:1606 stop:2136 length:531 start_codon:yes stop_codon:yes gene_type:complete
MAVDSTVQIDDQELTTNLNYLQPTGFRVLIDRTRYPNLEFFAQSVDHPSVNVNPVQLPVRRVTQVPLAGDKISYGELGMSIILDENMSGYQDMHNWLERIVNEGETSAGLRDTKNPTYADITVAVLSSHNNTKVQIRYLDCVPTDLGTVALTTTGDASVLTFNATFNFSRFEIKNL